MVELLLNLYAEDAVLESSLVPHLMGTETGVCRGRNELKRFFEILATRKPKVRQFHRSGYFTDGRKVMWEYPHATPQGEQMDFVEVMEIENGLIQRHRVYWAGLDLACCNGTNTTAKIFVLASSQLRPENFLMLASQAPKFDPREEHFWIPSSVKGLFLRYLPTTIADKKPKIVLYVHGGIFPSALSIGPSLRRPFLAR